MRSFLSLLSQALGRLRESLLAIFIGAAIFAAILLLLQGFFEQKADNVIRRQLFMMGIPEERFEELNERMEQGDESAFDELLLEMGRVGESIDTMDERKLNDFITQQSFSVAKALLPFSIIFIILTCLVGILSSTYFFVLGIEQTRDPFGAVRRAFAKFFPMVGLWIWIMFRSLIWIPVIGIFTAIYYMPRFILSPVILLGEGRGVFASVHESRLRTKGSWFSVVGNFVGLFLFSWFVWIFLVFLLSFTGKISLLLMAIASQLVLAFMVLFTVLFARRFSPELRSEGVVPKEKTTTL